jgi:hypothetical protein
MDCVYSGRKIGIHPPILSEGMLLRNTREEIKARSR